MRDVPPDPPPYPSDADVLRNGHSASKEHDSASLGEHQTHALLEIREKVQRILKEAQARGLCGETEKIASNPIIPVSDDKPKPRWLHRLSEHTGVHQVLLAYALFALAIVNTALIVSYLSSAAYDVYRRHARPGVHWGLPFVAKADHNKVLAAVVMAFDDDGATVSHQVYVSIREASRHEGETRIQVLETSQLPRRARDGDYDNAEIIDVGKESGAHVVVLVKRYDGYVTLTPISRLVPNARPLTVKWDGAPYRFPGPGDQEWGRVWFAFAASVASTRTPAWALARPVPEPLADLAERIELLGFYKNLLQLNVFDRGPGSCHLRWSLAVEAALVSLDSSAGRWIRDAVETFVEFATSNECTGLKEFALHDVAKVQEWFEAYARDICRAHGGDAGDDCVERVSKQLERLNGRQKPSTPQASGAPVQQPHLVPLPPTKPLPSARSPRHERAVKSTTGRSRYFGRSGRSHHARRWCGPREILTAHHRCIPLRTHG